MSEGAPTESNRTNERFAPEELEAHEFRAHRSKDSEFLRAFFKTIRSNPDIWQDIKPVIERRRDFKEKTAREGELHRTGVELAAGIHQNPEAALLYDVALRDASRAESVFLKEQIDQGNQYAPLVIIGGGGLHATLFESALLHYNPSAPAFGIEASGKRGGNFAATGDPAGFLHEWFELNSRNRPEDREILGLPGTKGNINPLGTWANLQLPDISGLQYATQEQLGRVVAHDNFSVMNGIVDAEVVKIRRNQNAQQPGMYEIEFEDKDTAKRSFLYTDIGVQATGLGKDTFGIGQISPITEAFIERERKKFNEGLETPRLFTFPQLLEWTTNNRTLFPLEDFRDGVGLIGSGDSAKVIIENLVQVAAEAGKSSAQLDFIPEIVVLGSFEKLKEDLVKTNRCRYARAFLEFTREDGTVFARVKSVNGKVVGLEETEKGVAVSYKRSDNTIGVISLPRVISATGFKDETKKIYGGLNPEIVNNPKEIKARIGDALMMPGTTLFLNTDQGGAFKNIVRIEVGESRRRFAAGDQDETENTSHTQEDRLTQVIPLVLIDRRGNTFTTEFFPDEQEFSEQLVAQLKHIEFLGAPPTFEAFSDARFGDDIPLGERVGGMELYRIGAATRYPLTDTEKELTPALGKVPENTAAIARFRLGEERLAYLLSREVKIIPNALNTLRYEAPQIDLASREENSPTQRKEIIISAEKKDADRYLPTDIHSETVLRYRLGALACRFPSDIEHIRFIITREEPKEDDTIVNYRISVDPGIPTGGGWEIFDNFFADALTQRALGRLTKNNSSKSAMISIPIEKQSIDIANIEIRALDRRGLNRLVAQK